MTGRTDFRPWVPPPGQSRIAGATPAEHTENRTRSARAAELLAGWSALSERPFTGITADGVVRAELFPLEPAGAPAGAMASAARTLLERLSPAQRKRAHFPVGSDLWRRWQNTELYLESHGLRLDEAAPALREAVLDVLRAGLSARGFEKTRAVMRLNAFLGDLVGGAAILGEWSFTFCLFGTPSPDQPWGWQLFGHHLSLNCFVLGGQMVLTPCFMGAEPAHADAGPHAGLGLFEDEEYRGLALMRSLTPGMRGRAIVARSMKGADLPPGRWHFADHLHLGGAYQDNRVVPYEGLRCSALSAGQKRMLRDLVECYVEPLPSGPLQARMAEVERHIGETRFCWIGGTGETSTFYYRIQSPVIFIEFDHHSGVFLTNPEPARFHIHTIVRTPNGNDYGIDLLRRHYAQSDHHGNSRPDNPQPDGRPL